MTAHDVRTICSRCGDWYWAGDAHPCPTRGLEIPLTQGFVALVDEEDYDRVTAAGKWHASVRKTTAYAARSMRISGEVPYVYLHTFLTGWPLVDHRNGNGLDNRRTNLREATNVENARNVRINSLNTSGFKGVFRNQAGSWVAQITAPDRRLSLGSFTTAEEAALVYDAAARELYGEFARLNFPDVDPGPMRPLPVAQQARTHCPVGHPYDAVNTYMYGNSRKCRACRNEACRQYTARKKAKT